MFDQIDFADQIGDRHVRRGELFVISVGPMHPFDLGVVALLGDQSLAGAGGGVERIIVDIHACQHGQPFVQQIRQHPQDARFGLAAQAKEQQVVRAIRIPLMICGMTLSR